ncbi:hypothetical protein [Endozoicomonas sp.]|uniref:hypothetical protein n=1 Tax=Endozoicomonas sp. TaxID=1892382 RepID=UPI002888F4A8|nr:hypothetical protein [Endozoicomonas sp.]
MFSLMKILEGMTTVGWLIAAVCLILWIVIIHYSGGFTEKRWGDRESGALAGFFVPGFIFMGLLYWM